VAALTAPRPAVKVVYGIRAYRLAWMVVCYGLEGRGSAIECAGARTHPDMDGPAGVGRPVPSGGTRHLHVTNAESVDNEERGRTLARCRLTAPLGGLWDRELARTSL